MWGPQRTHCNRPTLNHSVCTLVVGGYGHSGRTPHSSQPPSHSHPHRRAFVSAPVSGTKSRSKQYGNKGLFYFKRVYLSIVSSCIQKGDSSLPLFELVLQDMISGRRPQRRSDPLDRSSQSELKQNIRIVPLLPL